MCPSFDSIVSSYVAIITFQRTILYHHRNYVILKQQANHLTRVMVLLACNLMVVENPHFPLLISISEVSSLSSLSLFPVSLPCLSPCLSPLSLFFIALFTTCIYLGNFFSSTMSLNEILRPRRTAPRKTIVRSSVRSLRSDSER